MQSVTITATILSWDPVRGELYSTLYNMMSQCVVSELWQGCCLLLTRLLFTPDKAVVYSWQGCCLLLTRLLFTPDKAVVYSWQGCCLLLTRLLFTPDKAVVYSRYSLFPPSIKLWLSWFNWNIVENGVYRSYSLLLFPLFLRLSFVRKVRITAFIWNSLIQSLESHMSVTWNRSLVFSG
jgi:hypothetical protein